jgi:hypothetical protein
MKEVEQMKEVIGMKKRVGVIGFVMAAFLMSTTAILGTDFGTGINISMETEKFLPLVWMCDHRMMYDDYVQPGRVSAGGEPLIERVENYAFEGEQITWDVLVMDKNGVEKIMDVRVTLGLTQGIGNQEEANCQLISDWRPDGKTFVQLCQRENEKIGDCFAGPNHPYGSIEYTKYGKQLIIKVDLFGLNASRTYQLSLEGTAGEDGNDALAVACPNPNSGSPWQCGYWPFPKVGSSVGFHNFEMNAAPQANGEYHKTYTVDLPDGHYQDIKFLVKDNQNNWFNVLRETKLLEFWIMEPDSISPKCNARIDEEVIDEFNPATMQWYTCTLTVEPPNSMFGEYFVTVEAEDLDSGKSTMKENEYWFFNPSIALTIDGEVDFGTVRPGTNSYSDTILVGNDAFVGSGVLLDMFIAGTDFYDSSSSGAKCPSTNQLNLDRFAYFATNGAYSTQGLNCSDLEGYSYIPHGSNINQAKEIIGCDKYGFGAYSPGNVLSPDAEISLTFRLDLPEPCNGDFTDGSIYFWGEAV